MPTLTPPPDDELPSAARNALAHVSSMVAPGAPPLPPHLPLTAHFHPDRTHPVTGEHLMEGLLRTGAYVSQFVTGTSNGGLTAHPGGDRHTWEQRMFGGAYDEAPPEHRPTYAALNHRNRSVGAAPRFGSSYLRFHQPITQRATFCYPDSSTHPTDFAVAAAMPLLALADADDWSHALTDPDHPDAPDVLNDYIEAQVHGTVLLARDVAAVVLDPSFDDTHTAELAAALPCPVEWHEGFAIHIDDLACHEGYRGPEPLALARSIAEQHTDDGVLTPRAIGDAARLHQHHPQHIKQAWHLLARFGWAWRSTEG